MEANSDHCDMEEASDQVHLTTRMGEKEISSNIIGKR